MARKQGTGTEIQPLDELIAERTEPFEGSVQLDFIFRHKILKYPVKKATEDVGISVVYGHKINRMWDTDAKFRSRIMKKLDAYPDDYKDACKVLLPTILKTEIKGLKAMNDNPELAVKHPQLLKQMKQAAGIDLNETPAPAGQVINIDTMTVMQQMISGDLKETLGGDSPDTDVVDIKTEDQKELE